MAIKRIFRSGSIKGMGERTPLIERTLLIIKPDAMRRGLVSPIMNEIKRSGLRTLIKEERVLSRDILERLYEEHRGRDYFEKLLNFMGSGKVICAVLEGENCINRLWSLMGNTYPSKADPRSIRGKYRGESDSGPSGAIENLVHGSDGPERANKEIEVVFGKKWAV